MDKILITSALPYINGVKHLGNLIGSLLPADVFARHQRLLGKQVLFLCATDEHGTPAELAAQEAGLEVFEYCQKMHNVQKDLYEKFHLSFDHFGRSSSKENHYMTQHLAERLERAGLIEERSMRQVYSLADQRFLPDRYVEGTCPHCGYEKARGDQCESCTRLLDPTDLLNPRSAVSGSTDLEVRETRHLFLLQSKMSGALRSWIEAQKTWPSLVRSIALKWLDEGLEDRCITRDLHWGVPVQREGFEGKVFYVWFDAPIEYIAATMEWAAKDPEHRNWEDWWKGAPAQSVRYVQVMGKDNVPFHTVGFPATLMGADEQWRPVSFIKGFNWMNYYGGKFSTSQKRGIFMNQALDLFPADYWRWYLLANAPEGSDSSFTWTNFQSAVNKDLADVLGNAFNRLLKFTHARFDGHIPTIDLSTGDEDQYILQLQGHLTAYHQAMDMLEIRKSAQELRACWVLCNEYLQSAQPWAVLKEDPSLAKKRVGFAFCLLHSVAIMSRPFIPELSQKMLQMLGSEQGDMLPTDAKALVALTPLGGKLQPAEVLVQKIDDDEIDVLEKQFSGA